MLKHDKKKRKEQGDAAPAGYKPRAANPALEKKREEQAAAAPDGAEEKTEE